MIYLSQKEAISFCCMRRAVLFLVLSTFVTLLFGLSNTAYAQNTCPFVVTKFRAQTSTSSMWLDPLTVDLSDASQIRVVAFQCTAAEGTACDTVAPNAQVQLSGAGINQTVTVSPSSIPLIELNQSGTIQATVTTPNATGSSCTDTGTIVVTGSSIPAPTPTPTPTPSPSPSPQPTQPVTLPETDVPSSNARTAFILLVGTVSTSLGILLYKSKYYK